VLNSQRDMFEKKLIRIFSVAPAEDEDKDEEHYVIVPLMEMVFMIISVSPVRQSSSSSCLESNA